MDTVRAALGDTGSKGTIAPMLKQWKAQRQGETAAADAGLPTDLLEAVKGVYQRLEAGAQAQVEQMRAAHDKARKEDGRQLEAERAERDALSAELVQLKTALAHERDERQHGAVAIAALRAENDGLAQRLADRAAEQRQSDRQGFESRIGTLEHDAQQLRTYLQEHQQAVAVLRAEKQGLQSQVERANGEAKEHLGEVYTLREQLATAREMASREHMDAEIGAELLDKAEHNGGQHQPPQFAQAAVPEHIFELGARERPALRGHIDGQ